MVEQGDSLLFAGRAEEVKKLKESVSKPGFLLLKARRSVGRTALLHQLMQQFAANKQYKIFYADVSDAINPSDFILRIAKQTLGVAEAGQVKQMRELSNYFTYLRPVINFNRNLGTQQMDFVLDENFKAAFTLEQLFAYLARQAAKVLVILDDLQEIRHFRDVQLMSFLPDVLKQNAELRVIGSVADSRSFARWTEQGAPAFLRDAAQLTIQTPDFDELVQSLTEGAKQRGKKINRDLAAQMIDWTRGNMTLLSKVSAHLSHSEFRQPDSWQVEKIFLSFLDQQREVYQTYRRLLTENQWLLLRGIAKEQGAKMVMGGEFVKKYGLGSASSVQTALDAIFEKEMVYEEEGRLYLHDTALSRWMELN